MRHEAVIRDHLRATLTPTLRTWFCYTCAKPAMRFSRNQTPEAPLPDLHNFRTTSLNPFLRVFRDSTA
jgi:hypothetical protein